MRIVYIDESGSIGISSREPCFIIAAIIFDNETALRRAKRVIKKAKDNTSRPELHASKMKAKQEHVLLTALAGQDDYKIAYLVARKPKLSKKLTRLYEYKNLTYNFLFGLLIKEILAVCDDDVRIVCDKRSTRETSTDSLDNYIRTKAYGEWEFDHAIDIEQADSQEHLALQAVDIVASTIYSKYNFKYNDLYNINASRTIIQLEYPPKE